MTEEEVRSIVLKSLKRIAPEANLTELLPSADIREALDIDSMDFNKFTLLLYEAVGIEIAERDYPEFFTVEGCVHEILARGAKR